MAHLRYGIHNKKKNNLKHENECYIQHLKTISLQYNKTTHQTCKRVFIHKSSPATYLTITQRFSINQELSLKGVIIIHLCKRKYLQ